MKMSFSQILQRMFVERYCVVCGRAISYDVKEPLCEKCIEYWKEFLNVKCRTCGRTCDLCTCLPIKIKKINHSVAGWCVLYNVSTNGEINKLFYGLKHKYDKGTVDFCAEKMKDEVIALFKSRGLNYSEYIVTYAPRSRKNLNKYGFDQSKKLAKSLAKKLGIECISTLNNKSKREQKGLNKKERADNAQKSYFYKKNSLKGNDNIILVDDIMTSGATMYTCAFQLYKQGAKSVVPVTFAKDNYKTKGVKKNVKRNTKYYFTGTAKGFVRNGSQ